MPYFPPSIELFLSPKSSRISNELINRVDYHMFSFAEKTCIAVKIIIAKEIPLI